MKLQEIKIQFESYSINELPKDVLELMDNAKQALRKAYAPYSKFKVAAALRLENGEIITGTNQENVAYPSGLCAERVALFYANAQYPNLTVNDLLIIAESGDTGITENPIRPCGSCRQVIQETSTRYKKEMRVILCGKNEAWIIDKGTSLLPLNFTEDFLPK